MYQTLKRAYNLYVKQMQTVLMPFEQKQTTDSYLINIKL